MKVKKIKNKEIGKKGASLIISWVLLVGFAVTLAVFVSTWARQQAEKTTESIVEMITTDIRCGDVAFNVVPDCESAANDIVITNKGYLTIEKFVLRIDDEKKADIEGPLRPEPIAKITKNLNTVNVKVELIPIIKVENKILGCADKKVILTAEQLVC